MRAAVRPFLSLLLLFALIAPPPSRAEGGDPDDRPWPAAMGAMGTGTGNSPGAAPAGNWSVDDPPGPHHDVTLDTRTGTWMSVDVSPDGRQLVFDLLGDLYLLPIAGGEAKSLTHGLAWDEQPRWSPDGKHIAFTSDRSGGDNLWVMDADGSHPRAVTSETFRLLNSPVWTPDGQYLAGRKHYTSTRSAGAGEIWLYHVSGGKDGVQMTARRTQQKDEGEPAFSPDGRYLYWSMDATPGASFEYNKDANGQIYVIQRLDRESGEIVFNWICDLKMAEAGSTPREDWNRRVDRAPLLPRYASWKWAGIDVPQLVSGATEVFEFPMVDRDPLPRWTHGRVTLADINLSLARMADSAGAELESFQSNHEGALIERIHAAIDDAVAFDRGVAVHQPRGLDSGRWYEYRFEVDGERIVIDYTENNSEPFARLNARWREILQAVDHDLVAADVSRLKSAVSQSDRTFAATILKGRISPGFKSISSSSTLSQSFDVDFALWQFWPPSSGENQF